MSVSDVSAESLRQQFDKARAALELLRAPHLELPAIGAALDACEPEVRLALLPRLTTPIQRALFEAGAGRGGLTLEDIVPAGLAARTPVRHHGRNTLPVHQRFEKRFLRPHAGADVLWGYNHQTLSWLTGPGYFVARATSAGEIEIDYREVPPETPEGWPPVRDNNGGVGRLVYGNMVDVLRRVSRHVTIGAAYKGGKPINSWFILCREA